MTQLTATALGLATLATAFVLLGPTRAQAQISETTSPHLVTIDFAPNSVDVTSAAKAVTVTANVTDDLSGVSAVYVQFTSPSGRQRQPPNYVFLSRISVTVLNGVFQGTLQIPPFSEAGVWKMSVLIYDAVSNNVSLTLANLIRSGCQPI